jgi:DNA-binding response OmpR family regulator
MSKRILIVDDERDVAMLLRNYLEFKGYQVEEAHNGSDALKRIFNGDYDLVLLDYGMRDIKGDRICLLTRDDDKTKKLPVIFVTAHVEVEDRVFKQCGADDVIYKPVNSDELYKKIEKYLQ